MVDSDFVRKSFRFILDRGIMGLGSGILTSVDGNQVAVVLPELHDDDYYGNLDLLKERMEMYVKKWDNEFLMMPNWASAVSANQPKGHFNIDFVLAYNPSSPSLYLLIEDKWSKGIVEWAPIKVFKSDPKDISKEIEEVMLEKGGCLPITNSANVLSLIDNFRQTSIRIIVFLSSVSYGAINYREV